MRILHEKGYSKQERAAYRPVVYNNMLQSLMTIVKAMHPLHIPFEDPSREQDANHFFAYQFNTDQDELSEDLSVIIRSLWADGGVQKCFRRSRDFQLNDSAAYYLNALERITSVGYLPTQDDILRARVKSTGIVEMDFMYKDVYFKWVSP